MCFAIASLGLPGLGNFIGEFLILLGSFHVSVTFTVFAAGGLVAAAAYSLLLVQRAFHGTVGSFPDKTRLFDLKTPHLVVMMVLTLSIVGLGVYPQPIFSQVASGLSVLQRSGQALPGPRARVAEQP